MSPSAQTPEPYRVGLGQTLVEGGRPQANLDRAVAMIERAVAEGCRLVVLPECLDFGWTDPSAREGAQPVPGAYADRLRDAAREAGIHVCAGLVERDGDRLYNAGLLYAPDGTLLVHHRKVNELDIGRELYDLGDRLQVVDTDLGRLGVAVCADLYWDSRGLGHALCRLGAQVLLSPSAWAVAPDHDEARMPYGGDWLPSYTELASLYDVTVIGVSNVGPMTGGPWAGWSCIGRSLAVGPGGEVLAHAPFGVDAETLTVIEVAPRPPIARGTDVAPALRARGYDGP
jgi:predicted amidohydrolase